MSVMQVKNRKGDKQYQASVRASVWWNRSLFGTCRKTKRGENKTCSVYGRWRDVWEVGHGAERSGV